MESTVIMDWGSHSFKAGTATTFPSEEGPQVTLPSAVRSNSNAQDLASDLSSSTQQVVEQGRIASWPGFEALMHYCLYNQLGWVAGDEGNLLLSQPLFLPRADQEQLTQIIFEEFNVAGFFLCSQPVLSAFALGKLTCLVTDIGHDKTDISAVVEGAVHASSSQRRVQGCSQAAAELVQLLQPVLHDRQLSAHSMQQLFEDCARMAGSSAELAEPLQQAGHPTHRAHTA
ncbi:hypothetical protein WJX74_000033 [Apatococcus lobatus]|uniref:Uncharacterized protein n=1 Tax=Apatococcus lobatus TaxID=904363 RepID=A0AAW1QDG6_9CHLO